MNIFIKTEIHDNEIITQTVNNETEKLNEFILDSRDKELRKSLIKLGWTPPEDNTKIKSKEPVGWVCPICGRGLSIWTSVCPCYNYKEMGIIGKCDGTEK